MKHAQAEFNRALSQALGDEPMLAGDLAGAFRDGIAGHRDALGRAPDAASWTQAAARLEGLAASFGARSLMRASAGARIAVPGDPAVLARIDAAIAELAD